MKKKTLFLSYILWHIGLLVGLFFLPQVLYGFVDAEDAELYKSYSYVCMATLFLYSYSFMRLKSIYSVPLYGHFLENRPKKSFLAHVAFLFRDWSFWVECAVLTLAYLLLPTAFTHPFLTELIWLHMGGLNPALVLAILIPMQLVICLLANLSALSLWQHDARWEKHEKKNSKTARFIYLIPIYAFAPIALLSIWNFVSMYVPLIFRAVGLFLSPLLIVLILLLVLFVVSFNYFRIFSIRKKCIEAIKKACGEKEIGITEINSPYLSAFRVCEGESFQIKVGEKTYSCKLVGSTKRTLPMAIHPCGELRFFHALRLRGVTLFSYTTVKKFAYDSEHVKILIVNPVPKKLLGYFGNRTLEIDNGSCVGDYKIYNATAFVRAIETDTLHR